jgi:hypothetical protein
MGIFLHSRPRSRFERLASCISYVPLIVASTKTETLPVAEHGVQLQDDGLLVGGDLAPLEIRPEVVHPTETAALAAPPQP